MRRFRVAARISGDREVVHVHVYDTVAEMRRAGEEFNGLASGEELGLTQCWSDHTGRAVLVVVRLSREHLGVEVTSHEMHHAATALYGAHVGDRISRRAHLNHHNEVMAHLFSDLYSRLIGQFYAAGYYDHAAPDAPKEE